MTLRSPVRSPLRSPIHGPLEGKFGGAAIVLSAGYVLFPPGNTYKGAMYDPSRTDSLIQAANAELAEVTAHSDPVGAALDVKHWYNGSDDVGVIPPYAIGAELPRSVVMTAQPDLQTDTVVENNSWTYNTSTNTVTAGGTSGSDNVVITASETLEANNAYLIDIPNDMPANSFYV